MDVPSHEEQLRTRMEAMLQRQIETSQQNPPIFNVAEISRDIMQRFSNSMQMIRQQDRESQNQPRAPGILAMPAMPARPVRPARPVLHAIPRQERRPPPSTTIDTADGRRSTQGLLRRHLTALARSCVSILKQRLPLYESRIQYLMDSPNTADTENQVAAIFGQIEQANGDVEVLRSFYHGDPDQNLNAEQLGCLMRVMMEQYQALTEEIAEDPQLPELEEQLTAEDGQLPELEEDVDEEDDEPRGADGLENIGLEAIAALMGAAVGLRQAGVGAEGQQQERPIFRFPMGGMQELLQAMGANLPANFFDDVPVPMPEASLQQMPSVLYKNFAHDDTEGQGSCNFCLEHFNPDDEVRSYPCCPRVPQHTRCLEAWIATHDTCIICKQKIPDVLRAATHTTAQKPAD